MSGGHWDYQQIHIQDDLVSNLQEIKALLKAAGETEHLIDWAESGDTSRRSAEEKIYNLWHRTFDELYE